MKNSILDNMKAAIFDMDGTILDSMPMWHTIGENYLKSLGLTPRKELWDEVKRFNLDETGEYFITKYDVKKTKEEVMQDIKDIIIEHYGKDLQLKEGAREFLEALNKNGIPCVLATATDRASVLACMERLDCVKYFKKILTCLEYKTTKSSPLIFEKAAEACGVKPEESVVFEDALHAIRTAHNAGFKVCAVYDASDEERTEPPLTDWERILGICDTSCTNLMELI